MRMGVILQKADCWFAVFVLQDLSARKRRGGGEGGLSGFFGLTARTELQRPAIRTFAFPVSLGNQPEGTSSPEVATIYLAQPSLSSIQNFCFKVVAMLGMLATVLLKNEHFSGFSHLGSVFKFEAR
jgi:hypothetical protein